MKWNQTKITEKNRNSLVLERLYYLHYQGKNTKTQPVALKGYVWRKVTSRILQD